ncbi:hypothetical protein ALC57_18529 [Trachymyrmex cornetzi]|uniref:THAP-type domain-containing protein n=1 Tax=Trachymyrmex cornetzi TaxID=471704 RepID=A0A151IRL4_9HYME|nr:hypothetical protein ALC57_18529 [Trachymyrmex cornetzi]
MRACCISGCKSSGNMPSHQFPKNFKRRIDWLQRLSLTEENENIINKLRVCYKHFKNSDYSCCLNKRRLVDTAVPSIDIDMCEVQRCVDITKSSHQQEIQISQPEYAQVEKITMDYKMLMQHDESIQTFRQNLDMIKKQVQRQEKILNKEVKKRIIGRPYTKRPNLVHITRKRKLSPTATKFYENVIKLQKETRRLRKIVKSLKNTKLKTIILNTIDHKGRKDETATVRQRFMDMIVRNEKVTPQVKF